MTAKRESDGLEQRGEAYERPTVTVLGTIAELTAGAGNPGNDVVFSAVPSDRRLKMDLRPVAPRSILASVGVLPLA